MTVAFELGLKAGKKKNEASEQVFKSKANEKKGLTLEVKAEMQFKRGINGKICIEYGMS